jgi:hypothetical protein
MTCSSCSEGEKKKKTLQVLGILKRPPNEKLPGDGCFGRGFDFFMSRAVNHPSRGPKKLEHFLLFPAHHYSLYDCFFVSFKIVETFCDPIFSNRGEKEV